MNSGMPDEEFAVIIPFFWGGGAITIDIDFVLIKYTY